MLYKGYSVDDIKNRFGHDLEKVVNECTKNNLATIFKIDKKFELEIKHMNQYYKTKQFEYPLIGFKTYYEHYKFEKPLEQLLSNLEVEYRNYLKN